MAENEYGSIPRERIQWFPKIDPELCTVCGTCVEFCHQGVFMMDDTVDVANPYSCIVGCNGCKTQCPSGAISFPSLIELREMLMELRQEFAPEEARCSETSSKLNL
ncbi:MAG: 4Fe-4S binding protein [Methanobacteriota archaeon]|nr:MAG: 4Fe-4S binding protein [Euryarchaeota archaeon]